MNPAVALRRVTDLLGGEQVFKPAVEGPLDAHDILERGLPGSAIIHLIETLTVLPKEISLEISSPAAAHVVMPMDIPDKNWLNPGSPSAGQQAYGDNLLKRHKFILVPSVVSTHSWNLIFVATMAAAAYSLTLQEAFGLNTRLHPPAR